VKPKRPVVRRWVSPQCKKTLRRGLRHRRRDPLGQVPLPCQSVSLDIPARPAADFLADAAVSNGLDRVDLQEAHELRLILLLEWG
jgi:hypothetical protein